MLPSGFEYDVRCGLCAIGQRRQAQQQPAIDLACAQCQLAVGTPAATNSSARVAGLCLVGAAFLWGSSFVVTRVAVQDLAPSVVTFARCGIAAALLLLVLARSDAGARSRAARVGRGWIGWAALCGVATGAAFWLIAIGMQGASSTAAGITMAMVPVWTLLIAGSLGIDQLGIRQYLAVGVGSVAFALLIIPRETPILVQGVVAFAVAAAAHACANIASHFGLRNTSPLQVAAVSMVTATLTTAPAAWWSLPTRAPGTAAIAATIALGVLPSAAAYLLYFRAVRVLGAGRAAITNYLIMPIGLICGVAALGERPDVLTLAALLLAGGALTLGVSDRIWPRLWQRTDARSLAR